MACVFKRGKRPDLVYGVSFYTLKRERRFSYSVGPDKVAADVLARRIERLERLRVSGEPLDADMSTWMAGLPNHLRDKLVVADLLHGHKAAAGKSINEHLADFAVSLRAKGDTEKRIRDVTGRAERIFRMAGIKSLSGIDPTEVDKVLPRLSDEGLSSRTLAGYVQSVKQFCDWAVQHGRLSRNPIRHMTVKDKGDRKKRRRPLTVDEVRTLVTTTADGPIRHGIDGSDRAMLYAFAAETGCRAGDVVALVVGDFDLGAGDDPVSFTIRSGTTKNRRERTLLLSPGLSAVVRDHLSGKLPTAKAFKTPRIDAFAKMLRKDCKAAGIEVVDDAGREIDFHGLRVTSASLMVSGGFDVKLAQQRLGHHDPALTLKVYAMTYREVEAAAVRRLPDLTARPGGERQKATGTHDGPAAQSEADGPSRTGAQRSAQRARNIPARQGSSSFVTDSDDGGGRDGQKPPKTPGKTADMHNGSSSFVKATSGIRTPDLCFTKAPLYH